MRSLSSTLAALTLALALGACSGGGSGTAPSSPPGTKPASSGNVTPKFTIVVPKAASSVSTSSVGRAPDFVSSATQSVTITLTNAPAGLTPTTVTSQVSGASCTAASPCVVSGPPSPPGVADTYLIQTFASTDGSGAVLDSASVTITPVAGSSTSTIVTLLGVPVTIVIGNVPANFMAGTQNQTQALTVTAKDASGQAITGTYASPILITSPDTNGTQGTTIAGTAPAGGCPAGTTCAQVTADSSSATLDYGGLAENPVTLTGSATGATNASATFTPVLAAIVHSAGPNSVAVGTPVGVDLFTNNAASGVGYHGTESYSEAGYTTTPYNRTLTATVSGASCAAFATIASALNTTTHATDFTATSVAAPTNGVCTLVVGDGLTAHAAGSPFVVTYTTSSLSANGKARIK